jgi:hypothetical protein
MSMSRSVLRASDVTSYSIRRTTNPSCVSSTPPRRSLVGAASGWDRQILPGFKWISAALRDRPVISMESLILAQDERWRRA